MVTVAPVLSRSESKQQDALRPRSEPATGILKMHHLWQRSLWNHSLLDLVPRKIYHRQTRQSNCSYCDRRQQFEGLSPIHCHCGRYLGGACHSQLEGSFNYFANVTFPPMSLGSDFDNVTFDLLPGYWQLEFLAHFLDLGVFSSPLRFRFLKSGVCREQWQ